MKTPEQGGDTLVHAALDPALATPAMQGQHLENHRVTRYGDNVMTFGRVKTRRN